MSVVDSSFGHPLKLEERATMPLAGGLLRHGYQCGVLWGAALAAGAQAYRVFGATPEAEVAAITAARRLVGSFRARNKEMNCLEISELELQAAETRRVLAGVSRFIFKGGPVRCFRMTADFAPVADRIARDEVLKDHAGPPPGPVSCAAVLARGMGESDLHAIMAAGLAGGIGLSGGACGALGTAIWIVAMRQGKTGDQASDLNNPAATAVVDKFIRSTGWKFECSEIAGRMFSDVDDHAAYLRGGGCSKLIRLLATQSQS